MFLIIFFWTQRSSIIILEEVVAHENHRDVPQNFLNLLKENPGACPQQEQTSPWLPASPRLPTKAGA